MGRVFIIFVSLLAIPHGAMAMTCVAGIKDQGVHNSRSSESKIEEISAAALQAAIRAINSKPQQSYDGFLSLKIQFLEALPIKSKEIEPRLAELVVDFNRNQRNQYKMSSREIFSGNLTAKSDSYQYHKNAVFNYALFQPLIEHVASGGFPPAQLVSPKKLEKFYQDYVLSLVGANKDVIWTQLNSERRLPENLKEDFWTSPKEAAEGVVKYLRPFVQANQYKTTLERHLEEVMSFLESAEPSLTITANLKEAKNRHREVTQMNILEFADSYLANAQIYFEQFLLPIHGTIKDVMVAGNWSTRVPAPNQAILKELSELLEKLRPDETYIEQHRPWISDGGRFMRAEGLLGESKAKVYRGLLGAEQKQVVYKSYNSHSEFGIAKFEYYFTKYANQFRQAGIPRILEHNFTSGESIKEYVHGLTMGELGDYYSKGSKEFEFLRASLELEKKLIVHLTSGFDRWFERAHKELSEELTTKHKYLVIGKDNHKTDNWVFSPKLGRWVLHDP